MDKYFTVDKQGRPIYVDEVKGRFMYLFGVGDKGIRLETLEGFRDFVETKLKFPRWTEYHREDDGLVITIK